jgi:chromosome segregation ATPase
MSWRPGFAPSCWTMRLSLQEQRIQSVRERMEEAHRAASETAADRSARSAHLAQLENLRRDGNVLSAQADDFDAMLSRLRQELARTTLDEQTLNSQWQELERTLSAEQSLWMDFSARLEELERALPASRRP